MRYFNFDLLIEPLSAGLYRARVVDAPAGQAAIEFRLPFSEQDLEILMLRVGRPRRGLRRIDSPELQAVKQFGGKLFDAVFDGDVRAVFRSSYDAANREDAGLRLRLRFSEAPELADLPWEFLYNPGLNRFITLSARTPLVRYIDLPEAIRPLQVEPPLQVLVMISSPTDFERLDVEREWKNLNSALEDLKTQQLVHIERLEEANLGALRRKLRQRHYHIFHFIGHGGFDTQAQDGVLVLEDEAGRGKRVDGHTLGAVMSDHKSIRLAILNACEGARSSRIDPFAGVAQSLIQQGLPAVTAMQFEVTDEAAITFSKEFYAAITDGYPVDAALAEARSAIFAQVNDLEWGTPVLYSRAPDGVIFAVTPTGRIPSLPLAAAAVAAAPKPVAETPKSPAPRAADVQASPAQAAPTPAAPPKPARGMPVPVAARPASLPERTRSVAVTTPPRQIPVWLIIAAVLGLLALAALLLFGSGALNQTSGGTTAQTSIASGVSTNETTAAAPTTNLVPGVVVFQTATRVRPSAVVEAGQTAGSLETATRMPTKTEIPPTDLPPPTRVPPTAQPQPTIAPPPLPSVGALVRDIEFDACEPIIDPYIEGYCENGAFRITRKDRPGDTHLIYYLPSVGDAVIEVEAVPAPGVSARYGLVFRANEGSTRYYLVSVASDGRYGLFLYDSGSYTTLVPYTESPLVNAGANPNRIRVYSQGSQIDVELNGRWLARRNDNTLSEGVVGMFVEADESNQNVIFDHLAIWEIR